MSAAPRVALIINPVATRLRPAHRALATRALAAHGLGWVLQTGATGDAAHLARRAVAEGAEVIVTLGGDGTAAEVGEALAGGPVALAPLSAGNANVFARAAGWPASLDAGLARIGALLGRGAVRELTLGRLRLGRAPGRERTFLINAGVGLDAETVAWIEVRRRLKRHGRQAGFAAGAALAGLPRRGRPGLRVSSDDGPAQEARALFAACGSPYTYLGSRPLDLAPGAAFDGGLGWLAATRLRPHELGALFARALAGADLRGHPALRHGVARGVLVVSADAPVAVQADGEPLGLHTEIALTRGPVLRLLDPR